MTESSENDQKRAINNIKGTIFKVLSKKVRVVQLPFLIRFSNFEQF